MCMCKYVGGYVRYVGGYVKYVGVKYKQRN